MGKPQAMGNTAPIPEDEELLFEQSQRDEQYDDGMSYQDGGSDLGSPTGIDQYEMQSPSSANTTQGQLDRLENMMRATIRLVQGGQGSNEGIMDRYLRGALAMAPAQGLPEESKDQQPKDEYELMMKELENQDEDQVQEGLLKIRQYSQKYFPVAREVWTDAWKAYETEDPKEYTHVRYTPVVSSDPRGFVKDGYTLRVQEQGRKIKALICVTLYNEGQEVLDETILGLCQNIEYLIGTNFDGHKGNGLKILDWREVAVAIVQDGIQKASTTMLAASTVKGFYSPDHLKETIAGQEVNCHLFEYTTRYEKFAGMEYYPPMPLPPAVGKIVLYYEQHPSCGACTGELMVERPMRNLLTAVQYCEWKVAHMLNKPIESLCGYLTVLPGAFSSYRYAAVEGDPLRAYFVGMHSEAELSAFDANMYLAEDRVLCLEVVAKKGCNYQLKYIKESVALADPVTKLVGLLRQRRRWLNGTFFAMIYALSRWGRVWAESSHSLWFKFSFTLECIYLFLLLIIGNWFGLAILFTFLQQVVLSTFTSVESSKFLTEVGNILVLVYLFLIVVQIIVNLNNRPEMIEKIHLGCALFFTIFMWTFTALTVRYMIRNLNAGDLTATDYAFQIGVVVTALGIIVVALLHGDLIPLFSSGIQYWSMQAIYINMLQVYAFCNTWDISWGTKDLTNAKSGAHGGGGKVGMSAKQGRAETKAFWEAQLRQQEWKTSPEKIQEYQKKREQKFRAFSTYLLISWLVSNMVMVQFIASISDYSWLECKENKYNFVAQQVRGYVKKDDNAFMIGKILRRNYHLLQDIQKDYPFGGLPDQSALVVPGRILSDPSKVSQKLQSVTVLADFLSLRETLKPPNGPSFEEWSMNQTGVNTTELLIDVQPFQIPDKAFDKPVKNESFCWSRRCSIWFNKYFGPKDSRTVKKGKQTLDISGNEHLMQRLAENQKAEQAEREHQEQYAATLKKKLSRLPSNKSRKSARYPSTRLNKSSRGNKAVSELGGNKQHRQNPRQRGARSEVNFDQYTPRSQQMDMRARSSSLSQQSQMQQRQYLQFQQEPQQQMQLQQQQQQEQMQQQQQMQQIQRLGFDSASYQPPRTPPEQGQGQYDQYAGVQTPQSARQQPQRLSEQALNRARAAAPTVTTRTAPKSVLSDFTVNMPLGPPQLRQNQQQQRDMLPKTPGTTRSVFSVNMPFGMGMLADQQNDQGNAIAQNPLYLDSSLGSGRGSIDSSQHTGSGTDRIPAAHNPGTSNLQDAPSTGSLYDYNGMSTSQASSPIMSPGPAPSRTGIGRNRSINSGMALPNVTVSGSNDTGSSSASPNDQNTDYYARQQTAETVLEMDQQHGNQWNDQDPDDSLGWRQ